MTMITIIGRGHSGTRAMSHTLSASGVFMGDQLNKSGDLLPPQDMYEACRVLAKRVRWLGDLRWDWSDLHSMEIPAEFTQLIQSYLHSVLESQAEHKGWKIPETTLVFPWIVRSLAGQLRTLGCEHVETEQVAILSQPVGKREIAAILKILNRAGEDSEFLARMAESPEEALREYPELTEEEKEAILDGDIQKIESWVGKLDERKATWLWCRLSQEKW